MTLDVKTRYVKVMIGRFQPFHLGHLKVLRAAIATSDHTVVVLGSAHSPRSLKNPWSGLEREQMIRSALRPKELDKLTFVWQTDIPQSDAAWVASVKKAVREAAVSALGLADLKYTLVGCHKGADTYYLELYKGWKLDLISKNEAINATDIRREYFVTGEVTKDVPPTTSIFMWAWLRYNPDDFYRLRFDQLAEQRQQNV
jgi:bifunctional NMN adenylyltransferase/nudix hydrolase